MKKLYHRSFVHEIDVEVYNIVFVLILFLAYRCLVLNINFSFVTTSLESLVDRLTSIILRRPQTRVCILLFFFIIKIHWTEK